VLVPAHGRQLAPCTPHWVLLVPVRHTPPESQHPLQLLALHVVLHAPSRHVSEPQLVHVAPPTPQAAAEVPPSHTPLLQQPAQFELLQLETHWPP
jgi:hypothetical protein